MSELKLPEYLSEPLATLDLAQSGKKLNFLRKTINNLSDLFANEIYLSSTAQQTGLLQNLQSPSKIISLFGLIICSNYTSHVTSLILIVILSLCYARLSGISLVLLIKRCWLLVPSILLLCSLPVLFNHFNTVNTTPLLIVAKNNFLLPSGLYITKYSAQIVALTILRSGCSLSIVYVLLTTTSWSKIAHGLAWLKFPCSFILILEMTYRYIFLLANLALQLNQARLLRSVGIITHQNNRKFIGHSIAVLFLKAHYLANEIFQAMRCRGFSAYQNHVVNQLSYRDYQFMVFNFSFIIGIFLLG